MTAIARVASVSLPDSGLDAGSPEQASRWASHQVALNWASNYVLGQEELNWTLDYVLGQL